MKFSSRCAIIMESFAVLAGETTGENFAGFCGILSVCVVIERFVSGTFNE